MTQFPDSLYFLLELLSSGLQTFSMEIQEALELVSYKLGVKNGAAALEDGFLLADVVQQAIDDKTQGSLREIDLKAYMQATKLVKQARVEAFKEENLGFLEQLAQEPGVLATGSGLLYQVLVEVDSKVKPRVGDSVRAHYHGTLIDGTVFDSSVERGAVAEFKVAKLIAGWKEGLQLMSPGSKFKFYIPQNLAYGERGAESKVPPYATLIFEVELVEVIGE